MFVLMHASPEFNNVVIVAGHKLIKLAAENNISV